MSDTHKIQGIGMISKDREIVLYQSYGIWVLKMKRS